MGHHILLIMILAIIAIVIIYFLVRKNASINEKFQYYQVISEQSNASYFEYDIENNRMISSKALADLYGGYSNSYQNMVMENFPDIAIENGVVHVDDCEKYIKFYNDIKEGRIKEGEIQLRVLNDYSNTYLWSNVSIKVMLYKKNKPVKAIGTIRDLHYTDKLTGMNNRFKFELDAMKRLEKNEKTYAFALIDLKEFKLFNEINGYDRGDDLLRHMADIIKMSIRPTECCARTFSDRFFLLLEFENEEILKYRISEMINKISQFNLFLDCRYTIMPYVGVFVIKDNTISINSIIDRTRIAQLSIKNSNKENIAFFEENIKDTLIRRQEIENSMEESLRDKHFKVFIQPKYKLSDETVVGGEALVRWIKGDMMISPGEFIPLFEQNGFITKLDLYMFESVCQLLRNWIDEGKKPVTISVNFSRLHIYNANFAKLLSEIADRYNIPHKYLEVEVTETIAFENEQIISKFIKELSECGFDLSIDDFGSGYSSLGMLKNLPFNVIKLDRSFFGKYHDFERAKAVVGNVIELSKVLNITTVAEGVETKEDIGFLRELKCDIVQGFYYAKPMPSNEFKNYL